MKLLMVLAMVVGFAAGTFGHGSHLRDAGTLTEVRMTQCIGYMIMTSKETGHIILYKDGDVIPGHRQLHYEPIDTFDCVYEITEEN